MREEVVLTLEEEIKSYLLYWIIRDEAEYCFDLQYRDDLTFSERVDGIKDVVDESTNKSIDEIFSDYGVEAFGSEGLRYYKKWEEFKKEGEQMEKGMLELLKEEVRIINEQQEFNLKEEQIISTAIELENDIHDLIDGQVLDIMNDHVAENKINK